MDELRSDDLTSQAKPRRRSCTESLKHTACYESKSTLNIEIVAKKRRVLLSRRPSRSVVKDDWFLHSFDDGAAETARARIDRAPQCSNRDFRCPVFQRGAEQFFSIVPKLGSEFLVFQGES